MNNRNNFSSDNPSNSNQQQIAASATQQSQQYNARDNYRMQLAASQHFLQVIRSSPFNTASATVPGEGLPLNLLPDDFDVSSDGQNSPTESLQDSTSQSLTTLVQSQQQRQQVMDHLQFYRGQIIRSNDTPRHNHRQQQLNSSIDNNTGEEDVEEGRHRGGSISMRRNFESDSGFFEESKSPRIDPQSQRYVANMLAPSVLPEHDPTDSVTTSPTRSQSGSGQVDLDKILKCFICYGDLEQPVMCPGCSKFACGNCLKKWIIETKQQCPHCRCPLRVNQLVNCRFLDEITNALHTLQSQTIDKRKQEKCAQHKSDLQYYCMTCKKPICSDCCIMESQHKDHEIQRLKQIYDRHCDLIKSESTELRKRLKDLNSSVGEVQGTIDQVQKSKDQRCREIETFVENLQAKLNTQLKAKLLNLIGQKTAMTTEIEQLDQFHQSVNNDLTQEPQSKLIKKSADLVLQLKEVQTRPIIKFVSNISTDFPSDLVPEFASATYHLEHFSHHRHSEDPIYSQPLMQNGITWRLKVYPNGNGHNAQGNYISVFLEMQKGIAAEAQKYEYRVEMIGQDDLRKVTREFQSEFEVGECWGYNRFYRIDLLESEQYLGEDDSLTLKFYVRAPNFSQFCKDQQAYILQLESKATVQDGELKSFRKNLSEAIVKKSTVVKREVEPQRECLVSDRIKKLKIVKSGLKETTTSSASQKILNIAKHHKQDSKEGKFNQLSVSEDEDDHHALGHELGSNAGAMNEYHDELDLEESKTDQNPNFQISSTDDPTPKSGHKSGSTEQTDLLMEQACQQLRDAIQRVQTNTAADQQEQQQHFDSTSMHSSSTSEHHHHLPKDIMSNIPNTSQHQNRQTNNFLEVISNSHSHSHQSHQSNQSHESHEQESDNQKGGMMSEDEHDSSKQSLISNDEDFDKNYNQLERIKNDYGMLKRIAATSTTSNVPLLQQIQSSNAGATQQQKQFSRVMSGFGDDDDDDDLSSCNESSDDNNIRPGKRGI